MKSQISKKKLNTLIKSLQKELARDNEKFIKVSIYEGALLARKNFPGINDVTIDPFISRIRGHYSTLLKKVAIALKGRLQKLFGAAYMQMFDKKINELTEFIKNEGKKQQHWNEDVMRLQMFGHKTAYKAQRVFLALFGIADALLMCSGFLRLGDITIVSVITGSILGFAQVYAAKVATLNIREIPDARKQKRWFIIATSFFTCVSLILGFLRYYFAIQVTGTIPVIYFNPLFFAALNMLLIVASCLITYFYHPLKKEIDELEEIEALKKKIKKSISIQSDLTDQRDRLTMQRQALGEYHAEFLHDQEELLLQVEADFDTAVGAFKNENIAKRTDNLYPPCFKKKHLPLSGDSTSFDQIN